MTCHVCGSTVFKDLIIDEVFVIDGKHVMVRNIPSAVCARCSEPVFSGETVEKVRRIVHGEGKPQDTVSMDVFAFA